MRQLPCQDLLKEQWRPGTPDSIETDRRRLKGSNAFDPIPTGVSLGLVPDVRYNEVTGVRFAHVPGDRPHLIRNPECALVSPNQAFSGE